MNPITREEKKIVGEDKERIRTQEEQKEIFADKIDFESFGKNVNYDIISKCLNKW